MGQEPRTKERDEVMQRSRIRVVGGHVLEQVYHERSAEQMLLSNLPPQFWPLVDGPAYRIVALRAGWI